MSYDTFGMITSSLSPERKMLCAITSNCPDAFYKLMESDGHWLSKAIIKVQNEDTALHLCSMKNRHNMASALLEAGADVMQTNFFGHTSLDYALATHGVETITLFLVNCPNIQPQHLWQKNWIAHPDKILSILVMATPFLFRDFPAVKEFAMNIRDHQSYIYFLKSCHSTGNYIDAKAAFPEVNDHELKNWFLSRTWQVQSLQFHARIAVRRAMKGNIFYNSKHLNIPKPLQQFLIDFDE